jgi:hypothetical protein
MKALTLNCTLKRSPEESNTGSLAGVVEEALREHGVETDQIRLADHVVEPGVVSEAVTDADEWPAIRERILAADILIVATPTQHRQDCRAEPRRGRPRTGGGADSGATLVAACRAHVNGGWVGRW